MLVPLYLPACDTLCYYHCTLVVLCKDFSYFDSVKAGTGGI
nr:MAG TPA: hypothetical protein [Caudoviricetes sp.]